MEPNLIIDPAKLTSSKDFSTSHNPKKGFPLLPFLVYSGDVPIGKIVSTELDIHPEEGKSIMKIELIIDAGNHDPSKISFYPIKPPVPNDILQDALQELIDVLFVKDENASIWYLKSHPYPKAHNAVSIELMHQLVKNISLKHAMHAKHPAIFKPIEWGANPHPGIEWKAATDPMNYMPPVHPNAPSGLTFLDKAITDVAKITGESLINAIKEMGDQIDEAGKQIKKTVLVHLDSHIDGEKIVSVIPSLDENLQTAIDEAIPLPKLSIKEPMLVKPGRLRWKSDKMQKILQALLDGTLSKETVAQVLKVPLYRVEYYVRELGRKQGKVAPPKKRAKYGYKKLIESVNAKFIKDDEELIESYDKWEDDELSKWHDSIKEDI